MPTVFESLSDGFYTAFFEPDPDRRKEKSMHGLKKVPQLSNQLWKMI